MRSLLNLLLFFALSLTACSMSEQDITTTDQEKEEENYDHQVLFIGNSLTYFNNLPDLVVAEAAKQKIKIKAKVIAYANYGLEDHWKEGNIQRSIKSGKYKFVIIQQGPSSQADGRSSLLEYGEKIGQLCEANDAKLAYYMVWPSRTYYQTFDGVIKNYTDAAAANNALLCPVGKEWKAHFDTSNDFSYYGPDNFHPSKIGSQVAAEIIFDALF